MHHARDKPGPRPTRQLAMLAIAAIAIVGCELAGWVAQPLEGSKKKIRIHAAYLDLQDKTVAVMVFANEYTLFQHPNAPRLVCLQISRRIAEHVPGVTMMNPKQVCDFQDKNPHWTAMPFGELIDKMGVDRIVMIELFEYRTHDPGNAHVWQGLVNGGVGVIEADADDPDNLAFLTTVRAQYPEHSKVGIPNADRQTIEVGMVSVFARDAGGLFFDHEIER